jgi:hypothetical protein
MELSGWGMKLTTQLQLVPMSRKRGAIPPLPHMYSWRGAELVKSRDKFAVNFTFDTTAALTVNGSSYFKNYTTRQSTSKSCRYTVMFMCVTRKEVQMFTEMWFWGL